MFYMSYFGLILLYMIVFIIVTGGFLLFGYAGYKIAIGLFEFIFGKSEKEKYTFIDNSTNIHYHEHKNIHIIDDQTRENILNNKN